ncbi:hypothetical protein [Methylobacterium sp. Leaf94]|uniref:hypothetical protein n=1 Tax=Methylobacterium sp. Leaf94 TaxID=1736250 RepID=UPI000A8FEAA4|nr:hypothetical protein [Methylobacterium sp. Leaf94]
MTVLLLVALAGAANVALVAFMADRLTPQDAAPIISAGELAIVNDNAPASAVKLAA